MATGEACIGPLQPRLLDERTNRRAQTGAKAPAQRRHRHASRRGEALGVPGALTMLFDLAHRQRDRTGLRAQLINAVSPRQPGDESAMKQSEERREGKEWFSKCRSRRSPTN